MMKMLFLKPAIILLKVFGLRRILSLFTVLYVFMIVTVLTLQHQGVIVAGMLLTGYLVLASMVAILDDFRTLREVLSDAGNIEHEKLVKRFNASSQLLAIPLMSVATDIRRSEQSHKNTIAEIGHSACELSSTAEQLASNIMQQSQSTTTVAAAVTEISYNIGEISTRINNAYDSANESHKLGEQGALVMCNVRANMEQVSGFISDTNIMLNSLEEHTNKVAKISTIIREIAEQTNLLALNAAIEAARAGEYGRGFAVVADEVRALASRSHESAEEITLNIEEVQGHMNAVKGSMDKVVSRSEQTTKHATEAEKFLNDIVINIESVSDMVSAISEATSQQNQAVREISSNIEEVATVADVNSGMATQSSKIANHLYVLCQQEDVANG